MKKILSYTAPEINEFVVATERGFQLSSVTTPDFGVTDGEWDE